MIQIITRHISRNLAMLPALIMALALAACGNEPDPSVDTVSTPDYSVSVRISAGAQSETRALPEEFGTPIENTININNLKILVFSQEGTLKDILFDNGTPGENITLKEISLGEFVLTGKLDDTKYSKSDRFSIAALANWAPHQEGDPLNLEEGVTKYSELADKTFLLNYGDPEPEVSWCPANNSLIPMFGVLYTSLTGYSNSIFNEGNPMNLGTINVLRAVAKIEIIDLASNDVVKVTSIELNKRNRRGFLTPNIFDYKNTQQVVESNIPNKSSLKPLSSTTPLRFSKNGNVYVAYVPEMALGETILSRSFIDVNIVYNNYHETRQIVLAPLDDEGQPTIPTSGLTPEWKALLRNHIYRFTLNSITADPNIELTVDVQPFSCVSLLPQFGPERTEDGYIVVRDQQGNIIKYIRTDGSELTFKEDNRWPYLGTFMGVFDSTKRVLIGYFPDGRSIIFNYSSNKFNENNIYENLQSWEIYSTPTLKDMNGNIIPEHLEETFCFKDYENSSTSGGTIRHAYTHTMLDQEGRVIEEYRYDTLQDFQQHKENSADYSRKKLADYTGYRYGDKVVRYYNEAGGLICTLTVVGNTETFE